MMDLEYVRSVNARLEAKIEALEQMIEAMEWRHSALLEFNEVISQATAAGVELRKVGQGKQSYAGRVLSTADAKKKAAIEVELRKVFKDQHYSRPTYDSTSSVLLCLNNNERCEIKEIRDYTNASEVNVTRYTRLLRDNGMITFEGSRRKGFYSLTAKGAKLLEGALAEA